MIQRLMLFLCISLPLAGAFAEGSGGAPPPPRGQLPGDAAKTLKGRPLGGPCEYRSYQGTATMTRIEKTERSRAQKENTGGPGYEGYEIWFRFSTAEPIEEKWAAKSAGKEHIFLLSNSWHPGRRYIEKYALLTGAEYPCSMKVITRGTCTPVIFEFPTLKRDDYFESRRSQ